jgi:cholesterol transport system auxiliary component
MNKLKHSFIIVVIMLLTSCSLISPARQADYTTYVIRNIPCVHDYPKGHGIIFVMPVAADPLYDTDNMAYSRHPYQVEYFAKNKWADTPARMTRSLIVESLKTTHHFRAITTSSNVAGINYILNTKIIELKQVFTGCTSYVVFRMNVEIINAKTRKIIASRELCSTHTAHQNTPYGGVVAANQCATDVIQQLEIFVVSHT